MPAHNPFATLLDPATATAKIAPPERRAHRELASRRKQRAHEVALLVQEGGMTFSEIKSALRLTKHQASVAVNCAKDLGLVTTRLVHCTYVEAARDKEPPTR